uniref:Uncharacterized protein n=1 Tax=Glossina pallidipes TaxID=7398 RepID=A0A1B0A973_GLOPL
MDLRSYLWHLHEAKGCDNLLPFAAMQSIFLDHVDFEVKCAFLVSNVLSACSLIHITTTSCSSARAITLTNTPSTEDNNEHRLGSKDSDHAAGPNYQGTKYANVIRLLMHLHLSNPIGTFMGICGHFTSLQRKNILNSQREGYQNGKRKEITHARTRILSLIKLRITPSSYYKHLRKLKSQ